MGFDIGAPSPAPFPGLDAGRVPENESARAGRTCIAVDKPEGLPGQQLGHLMGVAHGRRAADVLGIASVMLAESAKSAQHVSHVGAEETCVGVDLVDDDEL